MSGFLNKLNDTVDKYKSLGYLSILKDWDDFFSAYIFDCGPVDRTAWYYNKIDVLKFKLNVLKIKPGRPFFEQDHFLLLFKGIPFLLNYSTFLYLAVVLYFLLLFCLLFCSYTLFWVPLIYFL